MNRILQKTSIIRGSLKRFHLGLLRNDFFRDMALWGVDEILKDNGMPKKLFLPEGVVIPFIHYKKVMQLRIRRTNPGDYSKYHIVSGSSMHPYRIRYFDEKTAIIVESELDGILLSQEIHDDVLIVALGAARIRPDKKLADILNDMDHLLIALDNDDAGNWEYYDFWKKQFSKSYKHAIPKNMEKTRQR